MLEQNGPELLLNSPRSMVPRKGQVCSTMSDTKNMSPSTDHPRDSVCAGTSLPVKTKGLPPN